MPRPRVHDVDELLDAAEQLVVAAGPGGLTLRTLATVTGVSNGSIYHAFASRDELLARVWLRTATRFVELLEVDVEDALADGRDAADAVVRAALVPVTFAERHRAAAALFLGQLREQLVAPELPATLLAEIDAAQERFQRVLVALAGAAFGRRDRAAVEAVASCVVDVPGGLLTRQLRSTSRIDPQTAARVAAAARAVLAIPPPERRTRS